MRTTDGAWNPLVPYLATVMRCPACGESAFLPAADHLVCGSCQRTYRDPEAVLDLAPGLLAARSPTWTPPRGAGSAWEDETLPAAWASLGPVDREGIVAFAGAWFRVRGSSGPVMDLQTGRGWMARQLARWLGVARVLGLDEGLEVLRATQASPRDPGMGWVRADPLALPFVDHAVAGVVCVGDPDGVVWTPKGLEEIARVLPVDGRLVGLVQVRGDGWAALRDGARAVLGGRSPPTAETLRRRLDGAAFEVLSWIPFGELALIAARHRSNDVR